MLWNPKRGIGARFAALFRRGAPDDAFWSELEATLLEADCGVNVTQRLLESVKKLRSAEEVKRALCDEMVLLLSPPARPEPVEGRTVRASTSSARTEGTPNVILVLGVNGVGKTTTIAKMARCFQDEGKKVLLVAADTFRAAAVEQLKEWGKRLGLEVVAQKEGADSAAVAFDGVAKAVAKGFDVVIIDTAGRLHTKANLMEELKKVGRVIAKAMPGAPHERLIVLDATVGSNGLAQAREFHAAMELTGAVVAKLDGTAKGGVIFAIAHELGIPITHIGVGEKMEDLRPFDPREFVSAILD